MPLYDFRCPVCGTIEEHIVSDALPRSCEKCGGETHRVFSGFPMIKFKGMGLPSRRKWMDNWTPDSLPFSDGVKVHGSPYESKDAVGV